MPAARKCSKCGTALPDNAPGGRCPRCLVQFALSESDAQGEMPNAEVPDAAGAAPSPRIESRGEGASQIASCKSEIANPKVRYFGDYELLEEIARGGMGVVWKARQVSLNRLVAVKMLLSGEFASPEFVQRFRLEAEAAANLDHPHIVSIHEVGVHQGQHYFSMDYVEGQSLAERARDNPLPPELAADYLKTIAEAIHYAHQRGILHRDLKPSNILIDPLDRPHITDFGLAKRLTSTSDFGPRPSDLTLTGQVLGSPNYMPPEQAEGRQRQLTVASDIYSLGAILYHLLTGRPPFTAETLAETIQALSHTEPVSPRLLNPGVPRDLETICLKCLEKDPRRRYGNAQQLAEELGHFLKGEPVQARPISLAGRAWRWCRRNPRVASLATATVLSVIAVAIGSPIAAYRISRQRQRADDEAVHAKRAEQETREQLWRSYLDQARANRWSGRAGRRFDSLDVLKKAAEIRPSLELRNEAIACMALPDFRLARQWELTPPDKVFMVFDSSFERYAKLDASKDMISIHRPRDDAELMRLSGFTLPWSQVLFSPNGQYLAVISGTPKATLKVWDLNRRTIIFEPGPIWCRIVAFTPNSRSIAVAYGEQRLMVIYDLAPAKTLKTFPQGPLPWSIAFDPSGRKLAISSHQDDTVMIRDVETGNVVQSLPHPQSVKGISWHPSGNFLATACMDRNLYIWDTFTGKLRTTLTGSENACIDVYFDHAGDFLISGGWDGALRLWDFWTGRQLVNAPMHHVGPFSSDDRWFTASLDRPRPAVWELAKGWECRVLHIPEESANRPNGIDFSSDRRLFVSAHADGARLWDPADFRELALFGAPGCVAVCFHPSGKSLFTAGSSGLEQWPIEGRENGQSNIVSVGPPRRFGEPLKTEDLAMSPDGRTLATVEDRFVHVFDIETRLERHRFRAQPRTWSVSLSPDGKWVAAASFESKDVWVWNLESGALDQKLPFADNTQIAFSPDGKWLVAGGHAEYRFWRVGSWNPAHSIARRGAAIWVGLIAFSADGKMLAITDRRDSVRLVDPETGHEWATLEAPNTSTIGRLRFNSDGNQLAVTSDAEVALRLWDLRLLRQQLAAMKLDWELPPLTSSSHQAQTAVPISVTIHGLTNDLNPARPAFPPRDPEARTNLVDLSAFYNAALTKCWFNPAWRNDLSALRQGIQTLQGTQFDLRGLVQLRGSSGNFVLNSKYPPAVIGIPVNQRCQALHFLHATGWGPPDGTRVGEYVLHYRDGVDLTVPLICAQNIRRWTCTPDGPVTLAEGSTVAWRGTTPSLARENYDAVLYRFRFPNPRPGVEIKSIDFKSADTVAAPFLVAITVD